MKLSGKLSARLCSLIVATASISMAAPAVAGPWLDAGDRQVRADVELLKSAGIMRGPINAWPLPWRQVAAGLDAAREQTLPPHLRAAVGRLEILSARDQQMGRYEVKARATTDPALVREFGDTARQDYEANIRAEHDIGPIYLSYGIGYRKDQQGHDFHFEPAHAAVQLGNWAFYGGYVDTWWGPGHDSALLFSTNARPIPRIGFKRLSPKPVDFPVLKWFGPWRFDIFAGIATETRGDYNDPAIVGMRLSFEPTPGLEIGLNRGLQLCGANRPCGLGTIKNAVIALGDGDNTGTPDEPGNQIAGFDISYTRMIGPVSAQIYTEWAAEDENNIVIEQFARLGGLKLSGALGKGGASWTVLGEWSDTLAVRLLGGRRYPGSFYNNFIYTDGFTYRDQAFGHSLDGDSEMLTLGVSVTDARNRRYYGTYRHIDINKTGVSQNRVSLNRETFNALEAGVEFPTMVGDINLEVRYDGDRPNTPGVSDSNAAVEIGWRSRF